MIIEQSFTVDAPAKRVWALLVDIERVAPCLPGAEITGREGEDAYAGNFSVKIGPAQASYAGRLRLESLDEATRTAVMHAEGQDRRGQGSARAQLTNAVRETVGGTEVTITTDLVLTGRLAQVGRPGMMQDVAARLVREFSACLRTQLVPAAEGGGAPPPPEARPIRGISLFFSILWERVKRCFRRRRRGQG